MPFQARTLGSGTRVIHSNQFTDEYFFNILKSWSTPTKQNNQWIWPRLTAQDLAQRMSISSSLAAQLLLHAHQFAVLSLDAPANAYYLNIFQDLNYPIEKFVS